MLADNGNKMFSIIPSKKQSFYISILNVLSIVIILWLPYYLFGDKLYIGGDDTKLLYSYPFDYFRNVSFFSWFSLSSLPMYDSAQFSLPLASLLAILLIIFKSSIVINHLAFSLTIIFGLIFFQLLTQEIIENSRSYRIEIFLGSLFYVLSPILMFDQYSNFYSSVWLIGLIPCVGYFYIKFLKTKKFKFIFFNIIFCTLLSLGLAAIPWLLGTLLSLLAGIVFLFFRLKNKLEIISLSTYFFIITLLSQAFWFLPFFMSYLITGKNNAASQIFSDNIAQSFNGTVLTTASGNIFYPLLNLFHRQIAFDYSWPLALVFKYFYDKIYYLNLVYVFILMLGLILFKPIINKKETNVYLFILIFFTISLYFFTVNIGPLKYLFLLLGNLPGFVMFRNFYDKFTLGFCLSYAILITFSLILIIRKYKKWRYFLLLIVFILILVNAIPIKQIVDKPLWTAKNTATNINLPIEYLNFLNSVKNKIGTTDNVLSLPLNSAGYAVISDSNSKGVYAGTSPLKIFTGINDYAGDLSFGQIYSNRINKDLQDKNYKDFENVLKRLDINYVILNKNIPKSVKQSFLFSGKLKTQDENFVKSITDKKLLSSSHDNYQLYSTKIHSSIFSGGNITFKKINPIEYHLTINKVNNNTSLIFVNPYNSGWKLYLDKNQLKCGLVIHSIDSSKQCQSQNTINLLDDIKYITSPSLNTVHINYLNYANKWKISSEDIIKNFPKNDYSLNKDGTINLNLTVYFFPQFYFYLGVVISGLTFVIISLYLFYEKIKLKA